MRVDHTKFALFEYNSIKCKNPFKLGDVVIKPKDYDGNECNEIGVVIQIHDENELRTDMFGNEDVSMLKKATKKEIKKFRKDLLIMESEIEKVRAEEMPADYYPPKDLASIIWGQCFNYQDIESKHKGVTIRDRVKTTCFYIEKIHKIEELSKK